MDLFKLVIDVLEFSTSISVWKEEAVKYNASYGI